MTVTSVESAEPLYRDASRPRDERVEDLLGRMTREEKVASSAAPGCSSSPTARSFSASGRAELLRQRPRTRDADLGAPARSTRERRRGSRTRSRSTSSRRRGSGSPRSSTRRSAPGLMAREATVFPQAIGLASTWDPDLAEALADVDPRADAGDRCAPGPRPRARHLPRSALGPDRGDVRRGSLPRRRAWESRSSAGFRATSLRNGVIATAEALRRLRRLGRRDELGARRHPAARAARGLSPSVRSGRAHGRRALGDERVQRDRRRPLRRRPRACSPRSCATSGGSTGCVASDYFSIRQLADYHRLAADEENAAAMALNAGLDLELPATDCYGAPLLAGSRRRDSSARRRSTRPCGACCGRSSTSGVFDEPYVDVGARGRRADTAAHRELARRIARKSIVLLKNDGVLPLRGRARLDRGDRPERRHGAQPLRRLRLPGPCRVAADGARQRAQHVSRLPAWSRWRSATVEVDAPSVVEALRDRFGSKVSFARGCDVTGRLDGRIRRGGRAGPRRRRGGPGDGRQVRAHRRLHERRVPRPRLVRPSGCPGGARARGDRHRHPGRPRARRRTPVRQALGSTSSAPRSCWPGSPARKGPGAIADVLSGAANPGGKLPISYPRAVGQVPVFYAHKASGGRSHPNGDYVDLPAQPALPVRSRAQLHDVRAVRCARSASRRVLVERRARRRRRRSPTRENGSGDEVVQLYIRDPQASITRPVLELKSFVRVALDAGRVEADHIPTCRWRSSASTTASSRTSSSRACSTSSSGDPPPTCSTSAL